MKKFKYLIIFCSVVVLITNSILFPISLADDEEEDSNFIENVIETSTENIEEKSMIVLNLILMLIDEVLNAQSAPQVALEHEILLNLKLYVNTENLEVLESLIMMRILLLIAGR